RADRRARPDRRRRVRPADPRTQIEPRSHRLPGDARSGYAVRDLRPGRRPGRHQDKTRHVGAASQRRPSLDPRLFSRTPRARGAARGRAVGSTMETRAHYVAVGAFVLAMVALAFIAVLWLARAQLTTQYALYDIYFTGAVSGLRNGAPVEYSGVPVGKVADVRIDPANVEQIRVTVELDASTAIKE